MEYNSILKRIEEQKREENLSSKLFRYAGLIKAIEFFSQKLNYEQIIDAAFDFVNELLTIEKSSVFALQGNNFVLKKVKGCDSEIIHIKNSPKMQEIALLHGTLIYDDEHLVKYFEKEVLEAYSVTTAIPLIIEDTLHGFIFIYNKAVSNLNSDDYIISESLMRLFNNALENYKRFEELQKVNRELDEKIFNLFAINQSSKALLSELSLDILYNLSVDVFSELTQSSLTGFVLYDEKSEKYSLKAYKDIFNMDADIQLSLTLSKLARIDTNKIIIDVSNEKDILYFQNIFKEGMDVLNPLKTKYIIMLIKNGKILGFVSLAQTVTGYEFKSSMFELIESMASSTYIALSNAQLFKQVSEQRKVIQGKLDKLVSLNNLMKNINSSAKVDTLLELTLKTLDISFEVDKALIALYNNEKENLSIAGTLNIETKKKDIKLRIEWKKVLEGDSVYDLKEEGALKYVNKALLKDIGTISGILIIPIFIEKLEVNLLGVIMIFKNKKLPISDEETMITIETIAGHISPVLSNLFTIEEQQRFLLPNYIEIFKLDLKNEINEALELSLDLQILRIKDKREYIFKGNTIVDKLKHSFKKVYPFSNNDILVIVNDKDKNFSKKIKRLTGVEDVEVLTFTLGSDFNSYQEFFKLF